MILLEYKKLVKTKF